MTSTSTTGHDTNNHDTPARGVPRRLLWVLLVVAVVANGISAVAALPVLGSAFGVVALLLGALLVRDHYRRRVRTEVDHASSGRAAA